MKKELDEQYEELLSELEDLEVLDPPPGSYDFGRIQEIRTILRELREEQEDLELFHDEEPEELVDEVQEDD